jgi:hypothetical protein
MNYPLLDNPKACGMGEARCCAFLVVGGEGFECGRAGELREVILARVITMRARRLPLLPFPECQSEESYLPGMRPPELDKVH